MRRITLGNLDVDREGFDVRVELRTVGDTIGFLAYLLVVGGLGRRANRTGRPR